MTTRQAAREFKSLPKHCQLAVLKEIVRRAEVGQKTRLGYAVMETAKRMNGKES